jgi:D-threo-aldose 1-dehydrogenase
MVDSRVVDPSSRRTLGSTGLSVSTVCIGCAPLGDMPETFDYRVSEERARETLRAVFESPINFLDTATGRASAASARF